MEVINHIYLHKHIEDQQVWTSDSKGFYTAKLCSIILDRLLYRSFKPYTVAIWMGVSPKKNEMLLWLGMHKMLCICFLAQRKIIPIQEDPCPFCNLGSETTSHILF
jgi:hypothetical protein